LATIGHRKEERLHTACQQTAPEKQGPDITMNQPDQQSVRTEDDDRGKRDQ